MEIFDLIPPGELTGFSRTALADRPVNRFRLSTVLPDQFVDDLVYRYNQGGGGGLVQAASYRAWDSEPGFGSRKGLKRVTGELPPIARQMLLDEYTQLRTRGAQDQQIEDALLRDAESLVRSIDARLELARGDALVNGKVTLAEQGVEAEVDFGRKASHSVTAAVAWTNPAAEVIDEISSWVETYIDTNGAPPGQILTTNKVMQALKRNTQLLQLRFPTIADPSGLRLQNEDVNQLFANEGWPAPTVYDARVQVGNTPQRVIAEGTFLLLPEPGTGLDGSTRMGATLWGTTLEAQEPEYGIEDGALPGIVVAAFKQKTTPVQVITIASAIGIPILGDPDLSFVAATGVV